MTSALLAGYCNTMVVTLDDNSMKDKKGRAAPRSHLDSPWYLATSGRKNFPSPGMKNHYYPMMPFSSEIVAANRPYTKKCVWEDPADLNRLYAGHLYRTWITRKQ